MSEIPEQSKPLSIWGHEYIDKESIQQIENALSLPISVAGALMPDAHVGYGLPIGGVLATENAVIPYAVGVDIACRMRMTIFPVSPIVLSQQKRRLENTLTENTVFGAGKSLAPNLRQDHAVLDHQDWQATPFLRSLHKTAVAQLGTSGSGNHFVEWGSLHLKEHDEQLDLDAGNYLALLSHSGSRGVGFKIANHYSKLAQQFQPHLEKQVQHLAWLPLSNEAGQEYWLSMELAGAFAAANHEVIHQRVTKAAGLKASVMIENHHNFAWKETYQDVDGSTRELIVHRKGATPAGHKVLGIIPGSMADAGYVVRGKGKPTALNSASHGAGRRMSRRAANKSITKTERDRYIRKQGVTLFGGDLDEAPQAYKNIDEVIKAQADLIDIVGKFTPKIVRMDGKNRR